MKKLQSAFYLLIALALFSSCSISEEMDLSGGANGGYYKVDADMGQALTMMKSMGGGDQLKDSSMAGAKDSSFSLFNQVDSIREFFTDKELQYFLNGKGEMKMNMEENLFTMQLRYPIKDLKDMQQFFATQHKIDSITKANKDSIPETQDEADMPIGQKNPPDFSKMLTPKTAYIITDTSISREGIEKADMGGEMGDMKGMEMFFGQITISTTIKLPRPAKIVKGDNARLLEDKKTVVISASMLELVSSKESTKFYISF